MYEVMRSSGDPRLRENQPEQKEAIGPLQAADAPLGADELIRGNEENTVNKEEASIDPSAEELLYGDDDGRCTETSLHGLSLASNQTKGNL